MKHLVESIRSIENMMGKEQKIIQPSEKKKPFFNEKISLFIKKYK